MEGCVETAQDQCSHCGGTGTVPTKVISLSLNDQERWNQLERKESRYRRMGDFARLSSLLFLVSAVLFGSLDMGNVEAWFVLTAVLGIVFVLSGSLFVIINCRAKKETMLTEYHINKNDTWRFAK